jgi:hypothetical protein
MHAGPSRSHSDSAGNDELCSGPDLCSTERRAWARILKATRPRMHSAAAVTEKELLRLFTAFDPKHVCVYVCVAASPARQAAAQPLDIRADDSTPPSLSALGPFARAIRVIPTQ